MARSVRIITLPGVFQPHGDARLLAAAMRERGLAVGARVLEVFTGSGAVAIAAAREGAREVIVVDVSRRALATSWFNARRNGVRVRVRRGDLFAPVAGERFDLILGLRSAARMRRSHGSRPPACTPSASPRSAGRSGR